MSEEINNQETADQEVEEKNIKVKGGIMMFRTEEDGIVFQPYEDLSITDLTLFAEYLNQLKDKEWATRIESQIEGGKIED